MPEQKAVVITLRKYVNDQDEAQDFLDELKPHLEEFEGLIITGHYSNHFDQEIIP